MKASEAGARRPVLMVVGADTADDGLAPTGRDGYARRPDFALLRDALADAGDVQVLDLRVLRSHPVGRLALRLLGMYVALGVAAFLRSRRVGAVWCDNENQALVLAALLKISRRRVPVVCAGIYPAKWQKWPAWRLLKVHTHLDRVLALGSEQAERLGGVFGVPAGQVSAVPYGVDTEFWSPARAEPMRRSRPYVLAAGLQHRDYATLVEATADLGVDLVVAAGSHWATTRQGLPAEGRRPHVEVVTLDYLALRDAYAGAAVVVAPTLEADFGPGITSMVEAQSMGRPVVWTRAAGSVDYVTDRRRVLRRGPLRATAASFASRSDDRSAQGATGFYVPAGDPDELREALRYLLQNPDVAEDLGGQGRRSMVAVHRVEDYVGAHLAALADVRR